MGRCKKLATMRSITSDVMMMPSTRLEWLDENYSHPFRAISNRVRHKQMTVGAIVHVQSLWQR